MKFMKYILFLILICQFSLGDILISKILYDPLGADSGYEWIEIFNNGEASSLNGYSIEKGNGADENDWSLVWSGSGFINSKDYFLIGEKNIFADSNSVLGLQNGPDAIRLKFNDEIISTIGWGNHIYEEYYEGKPSLDASDGKALCRKKVGNQFIDSNNNSFDFFICDNAVPLSKNTKSITLSFEIDSLEIENIEIEDDDDFEDGFQISPFPSQERKVPISVSVIGSCKDISGKILWNNDIIPLRIGENCSLNGNLSIPYNISPGNNSLDVIVEKGNLQRSKDINFTILSLAAFDIDNSFVSIEKALPGNEIFIQGDLNFGSIAPTLKNIGNIEMEFLFSQREEIIPLWLDVGSGFESIGNSFNSQNIFVNAGDMIPLNFKVIIPETSKGNFSKTIFIQGVPK